MKDSTKHRFVLLTYALFGTFTALIIFGLYLIVQELPTDHNQLINDSEQEGIPSHVETLDDLENIPSYWFRSVILNEILLKSTIDELQSLLHRTPELANDHYRETVRLRILKHIALLEPAKAFATLNDIPLTTRPAAVNEVSRMWAQHDLEEFVEVLRSQHEDVQELALTSIIESRNDLSESSLRAIATKLNLENKLIHLLDKSRENTENYDPDEIWSKLTQQDNKSSQTVAQITQAMLSIFERDGSERMENLFSTLSPESFRREVISLVLLNLAANYPKLVIAIAMNYRHEIEEFQFLDIVQASAERNPYAVFKAFSAFPISESHDLLLQKIIDTWIEIDPYGILQHLDEIPEYIQHDLLLKTIRFTLRFSPSDAAHFLHNISEDKQPIMTEVVRMWSFQSASEALDWVMEQQITIPYRNDLLKVLVMQLELDQLEEIVSTTDKYPREIFDDELDALIFSKIAFVDLERAVRFLTSGSDENLRPAAYHSVGAHLISMSQFDRALKLVEHLPSQYHRDYYEAIIQSWTATDAILLINRVEHLPSKEIQSIAAKSLIVLDQFVDFLSDEQIEQIHPYLTDGDREEIESSDIRYFPIIRGN